MPFANDIAARAANNNAIPPDLSYITRARHGGADYVYSLLTGYRTAAGRDAGQVPRRQDAEGAAITTRISPTSTSRCRRRSTSEGQVQYADGTKPTVDQMAKDVSAFLVWAADPNLETRHKYGFFAVIFLLISSVLAFGAYRNVWRDVKH